MRKIDFSYIFIFWGFLELVIAGILFFRLPETIKINFNYILTTPVSEGSRTYIFVLPVVMLIAGIVYRTVYSSNNNRFLRIGLNVLNVIILLGTSFYLMQFFFLT
ncbi:MAG: hypothetical protein LBI11_05185 [Streptococcaceae bacterium]|nr:hypothetical protein [Streptococcaceae bacterium]